MPGWLFLRFRCELRVGDIEAALRVHYEIVRTVDRFAVYLVEQDSHDTSGRRVHLDDAVTEHVADDEVAVLRSNRAVRLHAAREHAPLAVRLHDDQPAARRASGPVAGRRVFEVHVGEVQLPFQPGRSLGECETLGKLLRLRVGRDDLLE